MRARPSSRALEEAQAARNALSKQIGQAKAQKDEAKAAQLMDEVAHLKDVIQAGEDERRAADEALRNALLVMPNLPKDDVPAGEDESDNVEYFGPNGNAATAAKARPPKPSFSFKPKEHFETGEALGMMDFETAAKISGARFTVLKSQLARMERAHRPVHARPAHRRARLHRSAAAAAGAGRRAVRTAAAEVRETYSLPETSTEDRSFSRRDQHARADASSGR